MLRIFIFIGALFASMAYAQPPSVEQIMAARQIIHDCQEKFVAAQNARVLIEKKACRPLKRKKKRLLCNLDLKIYEQLFSQFSKFQSEEQKIMNAPSEENMRELSMAYSSNCTRFANGILTLVDFSLGKHVSEDHVRYFKRERAELMKQFIVKARASLNPMQEVLTK